MSQNFFWPAERRDYVILLFTGFKNMFFISSAARSAEESHLGTNPDLTDCCGLTLILIKRGFHFILLSNTIGTFIREINWQYLIWPWRCFTNASSCAILKSVSQHSCSSEHSPFTEFKKRISISPTISRAILYLQKVTGCWFKLSDKRISRLWTMPIVYFLKCNVE